MLTAMLSRLFSRAGTPKRRFIEMEQGKTLHDYVRPLTYRPGEIYNFENREFYDVSGIIRDILARPTDFHLGTILIERLLPQILGSGGVDKTYVAKIPNDRVGQPAIMITYQDGSARLVDGYHRILKARKKGADLVAVYILTWEQTQKYLMTC